MTESNRSRTDAETHAEDRLVDAMLRGLHHDTPDSIRGRLERVRTAIESDAGADEHPTALPIGRAIRWQRYVQAVVGGAGALAAVLFLAVLLQPAPVGATDLLQQVASEAAVSPKAPSSDWRQCGCRRAAASRTDVHATCSVLTVWATGLDLSRQKSIQKPLNSTIKFTLNDIVDLNDCMCQINSQ